MAAVALRHKARRDEVAQRGRVVVVAPCDGSQDDAVGEVERLTPADDFHWLTVTFPGDLAPYIVPKGSIAIDGISLTVVEAGSDHFTVSLIPTTLDLTTLGRKQPGDPVNLEVDVIAKYVERLLGAQGADR